MLWTNINKRTWRIVILVLLIVAIIGPWAFDRINVPSEYACSAPFIRLSGDFCGLPLSGMWIYPMVFGELINTIVGVVTGAMVLADLGRGFPLILLFLLPLLPVFSTLLLILSGDGKRRQVFHLVVWGLAAVVIFLFFLVLSTPELPTLRLWGVWLYFVLAPSVLILEAVALAIKRRHA